MLEFNLLPDVKLEYLKARRLKRIVIAVSIVIGAASLAIFVLLLLFVDVAQKSRLTNLTTKINTSSAELTGDTNLNKILTIQNQLQTLPTIESQLPVPTKLFNYISELTPASATISDLNVNFATNAMSVSGQADSLITVNQFVDTLKFTTYNDDTSKNNQAFNDVILSSFSLGSGSTSSSGSSTYTITFNFDPKLFSSTDNTTLVVPQTVTTRSITSQPTDLFKSAPTTSSTKQGGN